MSQKEVVVNAFKFRGRSDQIQSSEEKKPVQVFFFPSLHCVELFCFCLFVQTFVTYALFACVQKVKMANDFLIVPCAVLEFIGVEKYNENIITGDRKPV